MSLATWSKHVIHQMSNNFYTALYRVIKKCLCTCFLYCNHQVHRDLLITLYKTLILLKLEGSHKLCIHTKILQWVYVCVLVVG